MLILQW